jgi:hypothetical protein
MASSSNGAPRVSRVHKKSREVMRASSIENNGIYAARKSQPAVCALGIQSSVAKRTSPKTAKPRRSGKWRAWTINTHLSYQGVDEQGKPVWS